MEESPLVTIGLTCFNCEKTIERALKSAINQVWENKEIILIDDCSTDNSTTILSKLKSQYQQIQLIINSKNHGLAYNENLIIKKAKGEFVVFFDGDDESRTDRITKQYERFLEYNVKHPNSEIIVYSNRKVVPINELIPSVEMLASSIIKNAPIAVTATINAINKGECVSLKDGLLNEQENFSKLFKTKDTKEGLSAFVEKRSPKFVGT